MDTRSLMLSRSFAVEKKFCASSQAHEKAFSLRRRPNTDCRISESTSPCSSRRTLRAMFSPKQLMSTILLSSWNRRNSGAVFPAKASRTPSDAKSASMRRSRAATVCFGTLANCRAK